MGEAIRKVLLSNLPDDDDAIVVTRDIAPPEEPPYMQEGVEIVDVMEEIEPPGTRWKARGYFWSNELHAAVYKEIGNKGFQVHTADRKYLIYSLSEVVSYIRSDRTSYREYIPEHFDCDDFAQVLQGNVNRDLVGIPFGTIWYYGIRNGRSWGHAVNIFFDYTTKKLYLIEPQNDKVYRFNKEWRAKLIII